MDFAWHYGLFLAKAATLVVAVLVVVAWLARTAATLRGSSGDRLEIRHLGRRHRRRVRHLQRETLPKQAIAGLAEADKAEQKAALKASVRRKHLFVLDFAGDLRASQVGSLREEVSAVLGAAVDGDGVLVRLESPGGLVHGYGLAASQLERVRARGLQLTVAVDKVAASGGYLMACVADRVVAAPYAVVGSIGVVMQLPNIHKLLKKHEIEVELLTAGKHKRNLTVLGENTEEGRAQAQRELDEVHRLFQDTIARYRPHVELAEVADGRVWYGSQALGLGLVDALQTSDDLILEAMDGFEVVQVRFHPKAHVGQRLSAWAAAVVQRCADVLWTARRDGIQ